MFNKCFTLLEIHFQAIVIIVFVITSTFIIWLMWLNRGSAENYELLKPIMGGLLISVFFVFGTFFAPIEPIKYTTNIAILTKNEKIVGFPYVFIDFDGSINGYNEINNILLEMKAKKIEPMPLKDHKYLLELVEYASLVWVGESYPLHWQLDKSWVKGISGGGGGYSVKLLAEKNPKYLMIKDVLNGNMYADKGIGRAKSICLPKNTRIEYKNHQLLIDNDHIQTKIIFGRTGFTEKLEIGLGEKLNDTLGPDLYAHYYSVEWIINTKRPRRWSNGTKQQLEWIKELCENYRKAFSFELLKEELGKH